MQLTLSTQLKFGPKPKGGQGADAGGPHVDGIHAGVTVYIVPSTPHPLVNATPPTFLGMESGQVHLSLARFAMGLKHRFQAVAAGALGGFTWQPIDVPFHKDELQPLADAVSRMMNDTGFSSGTPTRRPTKVTP